MIKNQTIKVRLNKGAKLPQYQSNGASGADVYAHITESIAILPNQRALVPTGLFLEIPSSYEIQVRSRSGLALKKGIMVLNSPGTIDSDYRGELQIILFNTSPEMFMIEPNMRIAQIVLCPVIGMNFEQTEEVFVETIRASQGFGSTGIL